MLQFFYIKYLTVCFFFEKNWIYIRIHVQQKELGPDPDTMNPDLLFLKKMQLCAWEAKLELSVSYLSDLVFC